MRQPFAGAVFLGVLLVAAGCGEQPLNDFQSTKGKFKIKFPGSPKELTAAGRGGVQSHVFSVESPSWAYMVTYYDLPKELPNDEAFARKGLTLEADGIFTGMNGRKEMQDFIKLQDTYHGIEYLGNVAKPFKGQLRGRSYVVGGRVYNTMVLGSAERVKGEAAYGFLDSFKVDP